MCALGSKKATEKATETFAKKTIICEVFLKFF